MCLRVFISAIFSFGLMGCATVSHSAAQKQEHVVIDSAQEVQIGRGMHESMIKKDFTLLNDPVQQLFINKIGQRIAQVSDRKDIIYHFAILDRPEWNAFALPGGYVYIYRGLFEKINELQLAAILAHEIAHVAVRHSVKKMQSLLGDELLMGIALAGFGKNDPDLAQVISGVSHTVYDLLSRGYSREDELVADDLAVKYLHLAGYDPQGLAQALEILKRETKPGVRVFEFSSMSARMQERVKKAGKEAQGFAAGGS